MPKSVPKSIQTCFRVIFLKKFYAQCSMEGRVFENFQRNQKICKIPKMPKIVPKSIQTCFELVLGQIFRKNFCPVFRGGSSFRKFSKKNIFKIPKMPKIIPKSIQTCFEHVLRRIFRKTFFAQCSMETSKIFKKSFSKFHKCPKVFPKVSKRVLNLFWVKFFEKFFLPSVPWRVEFSKIFKKKSFQNSKKAQNHSQKYPNVF